MAPPLETKRIMRRIVQNARLLKAAEYIDKNLSRRISRRDIALRINMSESYIGEYFKTNSGVSLSAYIKTARLKKAQRLLRTTFLSIKEISYAVGFKYEPNFDRAFKRRFGVSPLAYRRHSQRNGLRKAHE
jgi:two-component system response regulator YesN